MSNKKTADHSNKIASKMVYRNRAWFHPDPHAVFTPSLRDSFWLKDFLWDFPGGPAFRILHFQCRGRGLDHWAGDEIPHATGSFQKNKKDFPQLLLTETLRKMLSDF